jgi:hypothetical protein
MHLFLERTPVSTLNLSVSCESIAVPGYQPFTDRRPEINTSDETCSDSAAPMTTSIFAIISLDFHHSR